MLRETRYDTAMAGVQYGSFREFYPFYLTEHSRSGTRRLHFTGTLLVLLTLAFAVMTRRWGFLVLVPLFGYGLAWVGHFAVRGTGRRPSSTRSTVSRATFACSQTWCGAASRSERRWTAVSALPHRRLLPPASGVP